MRYLVEPALTPPTFFEDWTPTLYIIVLLMNVPIRSSTILRELPDQVKSIIPHVFYYVRARLVADTAKIFGIDSAVAKFEKDYFGSILRKLEDIAAKQCYTFEYVSLSKSETKRKIFVEKMNELLGLAGISESTEAQLLKECIILNWNIFFNVFSPSLS
jgi:hypothetical protein